MVDEVVGDLPTYRDRREYVGNMYDLVIKELRACKSKRASNIEAEPTGGQGLIEWVTK